MRRAWVWVPLAASLLLAACSPAGGSPPGTTGGPSMGSGAAASAAAPAAPAAPARELRMGDRAPDFTLVDQNRQEVRLAQFRGRPVQVAFYVAALSPG